MYGYNCENNYEWQKRYFQGKADPEAYVSWEKRKEREFDYHGYSEQRKFKLAVQDFSGHAATWWAQFVRDRKRCEEHPIETWKELKTIMRKRFVPLQPSRRNDYASPRLVQQTSRRSTWKDEKGVQRHEESYWIKSRETPKVYREQVQPREARTERDDGMEELRMLMDRLKAHCTEPQNISNVQKEQDQLRAEEDVIEYAVQGELLGSIVRDEVHVRKKESKCVSERQNEIVQKIESEKESESKIENKKKGEIEKKENGKIREIENKREKETVESKSEKRENSELGSEVYFEKPMTVHSYKTAFLSTNEINSSLSSSVISLIQVVDDIPRAIIPYQSVYSTSEETTELPRRVGELMESNFIKVGIVEESISACAIRESMVPKGDKTSNMFVDFQLVNKYRCYFLCLDNVLDKLHSTYVLSSLSGDHVMMLPNQISVRRCDEWEIVSTCDLYRWLVISVRLTNASSVFMSYLKHVLHASMGQFVFSYFDGRIVYIINYGGYLIFVELVCDHDICSRFQGSNLYEIHSRFSYPCIELGFRANQSLHDVSLVDTGSDHVNSLEQSSLHELLSLDIVEKSVYHHIGVRYGLHACLVKSFRLANSLNVDKINHSLHAFREEIVIIYFDDIPGFINTCGNSLALVEFDCDHRIYAIEFSSCEVGCDLSIPLMRLLDLECVNVNGKRKVDFVLQIQDGFILVEEKSMIHFAKQFRQCIEYLQGSVLSIVLVDYACDFELFDFLVFRQRELVDVFCFVFNPGIRLCGHICHDEFQKLIFDPGSLTWICLRMFVIIRFTFDPGIREGEFVLHGEFYVLMFDPGGYRTFHSFLYFYSTIYAFEFLGRNFDCILVIVTNLVYFNVGSNLEKYGLRVEEVRDSVDRFLSKGDRKTKFPGSDLWVNPFQEEGMSDLRTNPFQEEGNDTILTRLASNVNNAIQDPKVQRMIICDWAEINSRMFTLELDKDMARSNVDVNHKAESIQVQFGPVMRARAKRYKEGFNELIQEAWNVTDMSSKALGLEPKFVNVIQAKDPSQKAKRAEKRAELKLQAPRRSFPSQSKRLGAWPLFRYWCLAPRRSSKAKSKRLGAWANTQIPMTRVLISF